jgi:hypothetical protein
MAIEQAFGHAAEEVLGKSLDGLVAAARAATAGAETAARRLPPVESWNPPFCGDIDMRIARDGTWFYRGSPIGRPALVRLFASILRKDSDRHVLVTPVERVGIVVEDAPFTAVELVRDADGDPPKLHFRTNVDDWIALDADHPIRFEPGAAEGVKPYVRVRGDLWALVTRAIFLDLVELAEVREVAGAEMLGIESGGVFFTIARADEIEGLDDHFRRG